MMNNATQGTAASLLRYAVLALDARDMPVVLHIHDECVLEVPEAQAEAASAILHGVMNTPPAWAEGLPLKADVMEMDRFGNH